MIYFNVIFGFLEGFHMKKVRRSARIVDMTAYLLQNPHTIISLNRFSESYHAAKSSISEDLSIIKEVFEIERIGNLITLAGATGGVTYIPSVSLDKSKELIKKLCETLQTPDRLLPGGYLYMSDLLGQPKMVHEVGLAFATHFRDQRVDAVMTVETKGIPLAYATAFYLNVPVVIARRDNKVTEGSFVSINYVSGSTKRIQTMSLARRALPVSSRVLIIDDFMKAGGTAKGMVDLTAEFQAEIVGIGVLVDAAEVEERMVEDYVSLATLKEVDEKKKSVTVAPGNIFNK